MILAPVPPSFSHGPRCRIKGMSVRPQFSPHRRPLKARDGAAAGTLASHQITDYTTAFRDYWTADVLVVDEDQLECERLRTRVSRVVIKTAGGGEGQEDHGRNVTVNACSSAGDAVWRVSDGAERYALVLVSARSVAKSALVLEAIRGTGYDGAAALVVDGCTVGETQVAGEAGADSVLVRSTNSLTDELLKLLGALVVRHPRARATSRVKAKLALGEAAGLTTGERVRLELINARV